MMQHSKKFLSDLLRYVDLDVDENIGKVVQVGVGKAGNRMEQPLEITGKHVYINLGNNLRHIDPTKSMVFNPFKEAPLVKEDDFFITMVKKVMRNKLNLAIQQIMFMLHESMELTMGSSVNPRMLKTLATMGSHDPADVKRVAKILANKTYRDGGMFLRFSTLRNGTVDGRTYTGTTYVTYPLLEMAMDIVTNSENPITPISGFKAGELLDLKKSISVTMAQVILTNYIFCLPMLGETDAIKLKAYDTGVMASASKAPRLVSFFNMVATVASDLTDAIKCFEHITTSEELLEYTNVDWLATLFDPLVLGEIEKDAALTTHTSVPREEPIPAVQTTAIPSNVLATPVNQLNQPPQHRRLIQSELSDVYIPKNTGNPLGGAMQPNPLAGTNGLNRGMLSGGNFNNALRGGGLATSFGNNNLGDVRTKY